MTEEGKEELHEATLSLAAAKATRVDNAVVLAGTDAVKRQQMALESFTGGKKIIFLM